MTVDMSQDPKDTVSKDTRWHPLLYRPCSIEAFSFACDYIGACQWFVVFALILHGFQVILCQVESFGF